MPENREHDAPSWEARALNASALLAPLLSKLSESLGAARFSSWLPLLASLKSIIFSLHGSASRWRELARDDDWQAISQSLDAVQALLLEQGKEVIQALPEAAQALSDLISFDEAMDALLEQEQGRELVAALLSRLETFADDMLGMLFEKIFSSRAEDTQGAAEVLDRLDLLLQNIMDAIILPRLITPEPTRPSHTSEEE